MRERFDTAIKKISCTAFDVAAAPMFIVVFGVPALLIIAAAAIGIFAVKKIMKISREKKSGREE